MNTPDFNSFFFSDSSSQFPSIEIDDFQDMLLNGDIANKENISPSPGVRSVIMIQPQLPLQLQLCLFLLLSSPPSTSAVFKCSACPVNFKKKDPLHEMFIHGMPCKGLHM